MADETGVEQCTGARSQVTCVTTVANKLRRVWTVCEHLPFICREGDYVLEVDGSSMIGKSADEVNKASICAVSTVGVIYSTVPGSAYIGCACTLLP